MSDYPTPSALVAVPSNNLEQVEARQARIDAERMAHIDTLVEPEKSRFLAVEKAVNLLAEHQIPFFLWVTPEVGRRGGWNHIRATYTTDESKWQKEYRDYIWQAMIDITFVFARVFRFTFGVYDKDKEPVMAIHWDAPLKETS